TRELARQDTALLRIRSVLSMADRQQSRQRECGRLSSGWGLRRAHAARRAGPARKADGSGVSSLGGRSAHEMLLATWAFLPPCRSAHEMLLATWAFLPPCRSEFIPALFGRIKIRPTSTLPRPTYKDVRD